MDENFLKLPAKNIVLNSTLQICHHPYNHGQCTFNVYIHSIMGADESWNQTSFVWSSQSSSTDYGFALHKWRFGIAHGNKDHQFCRAWLKAHERNPYVFRKKQRGVQKMKLARQNRSMLGGSRAHHECDVVALQEYPPWEQAVGTWHMRLERSWNSKLQSIRAWPNNHSYQKGNNTVDEAQGWWVC